jgi:dolichol-phosphate mannosyltransferase
VRMRRKEMWLINYSRKLFYRLIDFLSETKLPHDVGDFRLVDKKIIDELRKLYDYAPYIRGTVASMGFEQTGVPYDRLERKSGRSKFRFKDLVSLGMDGILNHSIKLLRFATYTGAIVFMVSIFLIIGYMLAKLFSTKPWPAGFATTTILILLSLSLNSLFLGIIGEYIGRIYHQSKMRPISIIEKKLNFEEKNQKT